MVFLWKQQQHIRQSEWGIKSTGYCLCTAIRWGTSLAKGCSSLQTVASLPWQLLQKELWQKRARDKHKQAGSMGKTSNKEGILCTNGMQFIKSSEKKGNREGVWLRVVTGLPGWHRPGSDGGVWDKEMEKQSGGICNYRDMQRHSEVVIARSHIWCANDSVPITMGCLQTAGVHLNTAMCSTCGQGRRHPDHNHEKGEIWVCIRWESLTVRCPPYMSCCCIMSKYMHLHPY